MRRNPQAHPPARSAPSACPYARECKRWTVNEHTQCAQCAHCYQTFDRRTLALILAGRA